MTKRQFALDLTRYHGRFAHGDLTVFLTWFGDTLHPCLVIVPTHIEGHERVAPCVVLQRNAWQWTESIGDGAHCARTSHEFARHLRLTPDATTCIRISSIIRDHLGDLLAAPPAPFETIVVGDAIRTDQDGRQHYSEIRDRV